MGNCLNPRAVTWVDDEDWELRVELDDIKEQRRKHKKSKRGGKEQREVEPPTTSVKIKLTKKQLGELLVRTDTKGLLPIDEVIYRLMKKASKESTCGGRSWGWRPTLKSIPEEVVAGVGS